MGILNTLLCIGGKPKVNTMTKYPSIPTFHVMGERGKLTNDVNVDFSGETAYFTEKIDGTNVRILMWENEIILGSRENLLYYHGEQFYDPAMGIVDYFIKNLKDRLPKFTDDLTVIYGELYGGNITAGSKNYGKDSIGFRVFDVAVFKDPLSLLGQSIEELSYWREHSKGGVFTYGQDFLRVDELEIAVPGLDIVPTVPNIDLSDTSHKAVLENLSKGMAITKSALSDTALMSPEGVVVRNADRTKIVKLRFEDYKLTVTGKR